RGASVPVMRGSGTLVWVRRKPVAAVARYTTNNRVRMAPTIIISRRGCRRIGGFSLFARGKRNSFRRGGEGKGARPVPYGAGRFSIFRRGGSRPSPGEPPSRCRG